MESSGELWRVVESSGELLRRAVSLAIREQWRVVESSSE